MPPTTPWQPVGPDLSSILAGCDHPLEELAQGRIPAIVLREAYAPDACRELIDRLVRDEHLYDPRRPVPEKFLEEAIPEGYYREGKSGEDRYAWRAKTAAGRRRIDIGTSLGYRGSDKEDFLSHSAETHALFDTLFPSESPIELMYSRLQELSRDKRVVTAREPDGREYGPAIIRAHYGGYTYAPHFDSVRLRERREDYAVYRFEHQFAGVLVLQNTHLEDRSAQCVLHDCLWQPEVDPHLRTGKFHEYAEERNIAHVEVHLEPGDLYFFNTRLIHEVPGVAGELPRIVLATFIGYSQDQEEIFVWS